MLSLIILELLGKTGKDNPSRWGLDVKRLKKNIDNSPKLKYNNFRKKKEGKKMKYFIYNTVTQKGIEKMFTVWAYDVNEADRLLEKMVHPRTAYLMGDCTEQEMEEWEYYHEAEFI